MADVAAALRSWSATASSNSPSGSTAIGSGLDDNLRQIQATVRQYLASQATDMAAAATVDLSTANGYYINITGATAITAFGTESAGISYLLKFASTPVITHNGTSLILPGGANITAAAGDLMLVVSEGSGNWRCAFYQPATSTPAEKLPTTKGDILAATASQTLARVGVGADGTVLTANASASAGVSWATPAAFTGATQAQMEAASSTVVGSTPATQQYHPSSPKAWGLITPATTVTVSYPSSGVSVVKNATGDYTITHGVTFSSTSFAHNLTVTAPAAAVAVVAARTTTTIQVKIYDIAANPYDPTSFSYALHGDLV